MIKEAFYENLRLKNPIFKGIRKGDMEPMMACLGAYTKKYEKSEYIIMEQDVVKALGIVLNGSVAMIKEDPWANKHVIAVAQEGELFGECFVCGRDSYMSTVSFQAITDVEILFLPFKKVLHSCNVSCLFHHRLIENMVGVVSEKNMRMITKIDILSQKTLRRKIQAYLTDQAEACGKMYFEVPLGRVQMAEYLGVDRSALYRELNSMRDEGIIDFDGNTFHIMKQEKF